MIRFLILFFTIINSLVFAQSINEKLIEPIKVDSTLSQESILKYFERDNMEEFLKFRDNNFARCKIYSGNDGKNEFIKIDKDTLSLRYEIRKNEDGKISNIKYKDYNDEYCFDVHFLYDKKGNLSFIQYDGFDLIDKTPKKEITKIKYDEYGNLLNEYCYKIKNNVYLFNYYKEFYYKKINNKLIVHTKKLEYHPRQNLIIKETYEFDEKNQIIEFQLFTNSERNKEIYNKDDIEVIKENYFYENRNFPNLITKIVNHTKNCEENFSYYTNGTLIKYEKTSEYDNQLIFNQFLDNQKSVILKYRKTNNQVVYDTSITRFFDNNSNLLFETEKSNDKNEISIQIEKKYEYRFDEHKNWNFRKIIFKEELPKDLNGNHLPYEEVVVRYIDYNDFDKEIFNDEKDSASEKVLIEFLEKENFNKR